MKPCMHYFSAQNAVMHAHAKTSASGCRYMLRACFQPNPVPMLPCAGTVLPASHRSHRLVRSCAVQKHLTQRGGPTVSMHDRSQRADTRPSHTHSGTCAAHAESLACSEAISGKRSHDQKQDCSRLTCVRSLAGRLRRMWKRTGAAGLWSSSGPSHVTALRCACTSKTLALYHSKVSQSRCRSICAGKTLIRSDTRHRTLRYRC